MTRTRSLLFFLLFLLVIVAVAAGSRRAVADCVIKPTLPPALPPGCVDLVPDCLCDEHGQNCRWVYHCVTSR